MTRHALVVAAILAGGCVGSGQTRSPRHDDDGGCGWVDEAIDLGGAKLGATLPYAAGARDTLIRTDEILGYLRVLRNAIDPDSEAVSMSPLVDARIDDLEKFRAAFVVAMDEAHASHERARAQVEAAKKCDGADLEGPDADTDPRLSSGDCRAAMRLWTAVRGVELMSAVRTRAVARHLRELELPAELAGAATGLVDDLLTHADKLDALDAAAEAKMLDAAADDDGSASSVDEITSVVSAAVGRCAHSWTGSGGHDDAGGDPRDNTVVVRPKYPDAVESEFAGGAFGSGILVRWRNGDGDTQTRIVTNAHVMGNATEAEITLAPWLDTRGPTAEPHAPLHATRLYGSPFDDLAVLRLDDPSGDVALGGGMQLRDSPVREREEVVAAGFPALGDAPSYQVTQGVVSNARVGRSSTDDKDDDTSGFIQHTAPIDPGNSGGPLLDRRGRVVGINTWKAKGRDATGFAIPAARVRLALRLAKQPGQFTVEHATAACHTVLAALSDDTPTIGLLQRLSTTMYDPSSPDLALQQAGTYRRAVRDATHDPGDAARTRIYGALRARLEREGGVAPLSTCQDVRALEDGRFAATVPTRTGAHEIVLAPDGDVLRVVMFE